MIWNDPTTNEYKNFVVEKVFNEILQKYRPKKGNPIFIRIAGQSGSGKSSQILPALNESRPNTYVLTVGSFMKYFQNQNATRESSNGFCLNILKSVLHKVLDAKINIILDMTLLTRGFEKILLKKLKLNNYEIYFLLLAVPKKQSDIFILKRQLETNRVVSKASAKFFNHNLEHSLHYLSKKDDNAKCVIWSAYNLEPVFNGKLNECLRTFHNTRKKFSDLRYSKEDLLTAKTKFLLTYNFYS